MPNPSENFFKEREGLAVTIFFTALYFLSSADQFLTFRLAGFNFRWGQLLLLLAALYSATRFRDFTKKDPDTGSFRLRLFVIWLPFLFFYALAALVSPARSLTLLKEGWAIFNIGGAALVLLHPGWSKPLRTGFKIGVFLLAALIWTQALVIYGLGIPPTNPGVFGRTWPLLVSFLPSSLPLGFVQPSLVLEGTQFFRPNAFYYEPSFAGSALAFAFPLVLAMRKGDQGWMPFFFPAFLLDAVLLCSSRTGILSVLFSLTCFFLVPLALKIPNLWKGALKTGALALAFLVLFSFLPSGRKYIEFITGPLGTQTVQRANLKFEASSSEGSRLMNMIDCLGLWGQHPFLGYGAAPTPKDNPQKFRQPSLDTWLEVGVESGVLGFAGFLFALLATMQESLKRNQDVGVKILVVAAWVVHLVIHLNLTQTFPRLDYWLLFYLSVLLLIQPTGEKARG